MESDINTTKIDDFMDISKEMEDILVDELTKEIDKNIIETIKKLPECQRYERIKKRKEKLNRILDEEESI